MLRLGERRSSSSSGDNPDFKENLKTTSMVTSKPRTAPVLDWDHVSVLPVQPGRQEEAAAPEALTLSSARPRTCPARSELFSPAGCSKLRYEMLSWSLGCEVSAGFCSPGGAAAAGHSSLCHSRLLLAFRREFHLLGSALATWTLHKLCTLVQSTLSICELSYLMLRMKT